jgi:hypothetical protein
MDYQIAIDPNLGISANEFVMAWNETPACRALAEARSPISSVKGSPLDPQMLQQGLVLLAGVAGTVGGLALDALKDSVKDKLTAYFKEKMSRKPSIKVEAIRQPGGAYLLVVTGEAG